MSLIFNAMHSPLFLTYMLQSCLSDFFASEGIDPEILPQEKMMFIYPSSLPH